jgi:hypothetical protein
MRRLALPLVFAGTLVAAVQHAPQISPHLEGHRLIGLLFVAATIGGFGLLLGLAMFPASRPLLLAVLYAHAVMLAFGAASRTVGLDWLGEGVEDPTAAWAVAMCAEAIVVVAATVAVRAGRPAYALTG